MPTEQLAWEQLRARRFHGLKFYRQRPWGRFVLDFYCPELRLAVEIDGDVHDHPARRRADAVRQRSVEGDGVRVVRVSAEAIGADPAGALEAALAGVLSPLRERGEGQG